MSEPKLEKGYYWCHLEYRVTVNEWRDSWEILHYDPEDDDWMQCGSEIALEPSTIVEIDPKRLIRS